MTTLIGRPTPLIDGEVKVTGKLRFLADLEIPGVLHARMVTSPYAHARIQNVEASAALAMPGVVAVLTAKDLPDILPTNRQRLLLARERVMFVGQPVALVLAESEIAAEDALEHVVIDYEPLPAVVTIEEALAKDAPLVWPEGMPGDSGEAAAHGADVGGEDEGPPKRSNVANRTHFNQGDVAAGFAEADAVVERTFKTSMVHQSPLEPHATAVKIDPATGEVTVWGSTQAPFHVRAQIAEALGKAESEVRVITTPIGGGFGGKFVLYEPLVALAAQAAGKPVQLILSRQEEMLAGNPAPAGRLRVKLGAKKDGRFTALETELVFDGGCYPSAPVGLATMIMGSVYRIPNYDLKGQEVLTFKLSGGAYRAPGVPQATFALESVIDEVAGQLGLDSLELRLQNAVERGDPMAHGKNWPSIGMKEVLSAIQAHPAWQNRAEARVAGRGVGVAVAAWPGGTEPASAACTINRDGTLHIHLGSVDLSGTTTGFAMIAAELFGVSPDKVRVVSGDTQKAAYSGAAGGSKITYTVGPALIQAVEEARTQTLAIAAELLEAAAEDLEIVNGQVQVKGFPDKTIPVGQIAGKTMQFGGQYAPVFGHGRHVDTTPASCFCAQLAEVSVDEETGKVRVHRLVVAQDVGKAINPMAIEGQMMGGAAQGLGWALYENMVYDEQGQLLTASFMDYNLPHFEQVAEQFDALIVEVPQEHGPLGVRGVGEPPITATAGAVANAIAHATGAHLNQLPMTPPRVLAALQARDGRG
jgi:CO/xanthine dehydrogenase Mo-binding subunit